MAQDAAQSSTPCKSIIKLNALILKYQISTRVSFLKYYLTLSTTIRLETVNNDYLNSSIRSE
jgi:hypothetical protein